MGSILIMERSPNPWVVSCVIRKHYKYPDICYLISL
jgi:hypothetical protein